MPIHLEINGAAVAIIFANKLAVACAFSASLYGSTTSSLEEFDRFIAPPITETTGLIPLIVGLSGGMISVIPVGCGIFIYYTLLYVKQNAGVLTNEISADMMQRFSQIVKSLFGNKLMLVLIAAFAAAIIVVFILKNMSFDYSWIIAIVAGTIAQLVVIFIGDITMDVSVPVSELIIGVVVSLILSGIYTFFVFAVDYSRTEYVQFEDDDYYYYVKAVPKMTVSTPDVKVQKINARKLQRPQR